MSLDATPYLNRLRPDVRAMHAYPVQDSTGLIKLDTMENPHVLPVALQKALGERLGALEINRYPGPRMETLKAALREHGEVPEHCSMLLGNGSDELISLLALAIAPTSAQAPRQTILSPVPSFVMYAMSAQMQALNFVCVPLNAADFSLDVPAMCAAIALHRPALTYLACPNNPTATLWPAADVDAVIAACTAVGGLVVLDEAYQPFAVESYANRVNQHAHVLVMRTLSKFGLAGVRLGYLFGAAALVEQIEKLRPPFNVSVLNTEAALFALEHANVYAGFAERIRADRAVLDAELQTIVGVQVFPSQANMVLVRVGDAAATFSHLKAQGILVKNVSSMHPLLANCLRLTVGTSEQNTQMLAALRTALTPALSRGERGLLTPSPSGRKAVTPSPSGRGVG